jgi:hypothetical protein
MTTTVHQAAKVAKVARDLQFLLHSLLATTMTTMATITMTMIAHLLMIGDVVDQVVAVVVLRHRAPAPQAHSWAPTTGAHVRQAARPSSQALLPAKYNLQQGPRVSASKKVFIQIPSHSMAWAI